MIPVYSTEMHTLCHKSTVRTICLAHAVDILTVLCFCSQQKILQSSPQMNMERV